MNKLTQLYDDVLSTLPISYNGLDGFDKRMAAFLDKLVDSNFIKYNHNLTLLFSAILTLPNDRIKANKWELDLFEGVFYKSFVDGDKEEVFSFYFYLLNRFKTALKIDYSFSLAKTLSEFFIKEVDFKVCLNETAEKTVINYDRRNALFEVVLPKGIIYKKGISYENRKMELHNLWWSNDENGRNKNANFITGNNYLNENFHRPTNYTVNIDLPESEQKHLEEVYNALICDQGLNIITNEIIECLKYYSKFKLYPAYNDETRTAYEKLAYGAIAVSFFCYYYNSSVEYMLSIASVVKESVGGNSEEKFRNIGGIIVAYKNNTELSAEDRTIFNLISDRVASAVVSQAMYLETIHPNLLITTSLCYGIEGVKEITHGHGAYYPKDKTLIRTKVQLKELTKVFDLISKIRTDLKGIDVIKRKHLEVIDKVNALKEYTGELNSDIQAIRNELEVKADKIKQSINGLNPRSKIKYMDWDCSALSAFVNPIEVLELDITQMLDRIIGDTKGLKLSECSYTIYSKEYDQESVIDSIANNIRRVDNYIIFMHTESAKINRLNQPNWLENLLKKNIRFIGDFFYSYMDNGTRKFFDINLNEADATALTSLNEVGITLTTKLNEQFSDLPIWYVFKFKTSIQ